MEPRPAQLLNQIRHGTDRRSWLNRIATVLCAACFGMFAVGLAIEAGTGNLLFDNYLSTFAAYGILFAVIASLCQGGRRA